MSTDIFKKMKRLRPFEPSAGILCLSVCVIFGFFLLDYIGVTKGLRLKNERLLWLRLGGDGRKINFLTENVGKCDVLDGDWAWEERYPIYQSRDCRFLDEGFRCSENGRPDSFYTKWRWQHRYCNLPRFDAKTMLEKLRNKRVVFAGDSIGRNQWESLLCMLSSVIHGKDLIYEVKGNPITKHKGFLVFKFKDYNCSVEYYRAPFLVLQSRPPPHVSSRIRTTLKLDQMDWMLSRWKDADIIVLNLGHWWNYEKTARGLESEDGYGSRHCVPKSTRNGYKLDKPRSKYYQNASLLSYIFPPTLQAKLHGWNLKEYEIPRGGDWRSGGTCHTETLPELGPTVLPSHTWTKYTIFGRLMASNHLNLSHSRPLDVLNITHMTSRRKDGHSSLYYLGPKIGPAHLHKQDCSHWCLPGVPDAWNELLYAIFLKRETVRKLSSSTFNAKVR